MQQELFAETQFNELSARVFTNQIRPHALRLL